MPSQLKPDPTVCPSESPSARANVPGGCEAIRVTSVMPGDAVMIVNEESAKAAVATAGSDDLAKCVNGDSSEKIRWGFCNTRVWPVAMLRSGMKPVSRGPLSRGGMELHAMPLDDPYLHMDGAVAPSFCQVFRRHGACR